MSHAQTFISYSRADSSFALQLAQDLRTAGFTVWLDQLDIPGGLRWDAEIEKALDASDKVLVVLSAQSVQSNNVMDEISYALEEGKRVIPVLIAPCEIPFRIRRLQYIDFSAGYDQGLPRLQRVLSDSVENTPQSPRVQTETRPDRAPNKPGERIVTKNPPSQKAATETPKQASRSKYMLIGGVAGGLLVILLLVLLVSQGGDAEVKNATATDSTTENVDSTTAPAASESQTPDPQPEFKPAANVSEEFANKTLKLLQDEFAKSEGQINNKFKYELELLDDRYVFSIEPKDEAEPTAEMEKAVEEFGKLLASSVFPEKRLRVMLYHPKTKEYTYVDYPQ